MINLLSNTYIIEFVFLTNEVNIYVKECLVKWYIKYFISVISRNLVFKATGPSISNRKIGPVGITVFASKRISHVASYIIDIRY